MIVYYGGAFGFQILSRLHGSAAFKSLTPALLSSIVYIILFELADLEEDDNQILDHPYPMAALVAAFTFLLAFRANFSYNRYWEAHTAVHQMHSKWLDVGMELAAFHYQADIYNDRKPPAFGAHPNVKVIDIVRERLNEPSKEDLEQTISEVENLPVSTRSRFQSLFKRKKNNNNSNNSGHGSGRASQAGGATSTRSTASTAKSINRKENVKFSEDTIQRDKDGKPVPIFTKTCRESFQRGGLDPKKPSLFLEEAAHLLSLLSAVAMSTLRNDLEEAESPLIEFKPGVQWPHVDPDSFSADVRKGWNPSNQMPPAMRYLLGLSRNKASRTLYNAARPFRVIGNVSDQEIELLQCAQGPLAKVALCTMWLQEFISREYMAGSTGKVAPPIISRLYQYTSDGMVGYNQARKIAYIPFPFPHAQITTLFVLVVVGFIPVLMLSFLKNEIFGFILNLLTVMCFTGLHEVARELEAPFQNVPNDVPLNNFQAQFNEGLMVMFFGYHPDSWWKEHQDEMGTYPPAPSNNDQSANGGVAAASDGAAEPKEGPKEDVKKET